MKKLKKFLCVALVLVLLFASAPTIPIADLGFGITASALSATGQCGENVYWSFGKETGILIIFGEGEMYDYDRVNDSKSPFDENYEIVQIIVDDKVTTIGAASFYGCESVVYVSLPDSITTIGDAAFSNCTNLEDITIPDSVTTIGARAFAGCAKLERIIVDENNPVYSNDSNGVLFNKSKTLLIQYPCGNPKTSYSIPDSVTTINMAAFSNCHNLTNVTIPCSISTIEATTFYKCDSLVSITIPDSVTTIGDFAFVGCSSLTNITIPNSVTTIGDWAFAWCENLTSVTIPDSVTTIYPSYFTDCAKLERIIVDENSAIYSNDSNGVLFSKNKISLILYPCGNTKTSYIIPDSVTFIDDGAFRGCNNLTNVTIPDSVTTIGYYAFSSCESLTDVYYGGSKTQWDDIYIGEYNDDLLNATIHYNCSGYEPVEELTLNYEALTISNNICPNISVKTYPDGVTEDDILWTSSNERVAYINGSTVNPIQYGKTLITASTKDGKYSASCELTVQSSFVITSTNNSLSSIKVGDTAEYSIMLLDYEGNKLPIENVTLSNESSKYLEIIKHERTEKEIKLTVKALKAGAAVLEFGNNEPLTYNKFVFDIYPSAVTYRADQVPIRDKDLKTNFSRSGIYVENFRYYAVGEPTDYYTALMNVYNKNSSVGIVASYTQDGQLYDIAEVKKHQALPTDYFEFLTVLGKGAVDIALLNTYNYRYSVESTKTEIEIKVPENGYITVSNDITSCPITFVYGIMSVAVSTAFQLAEDLTTIEKNKESDVVKELTKKVTNYFTKDPKILDKFIKELSKKILKETTKSNITFMGEYSLELASKIFEEIDLNFEDVLKDVLKEVLKDSAHKFVSMELMKLFLSNNIIQTAEGGYIKAAEMMFLAADNVNVLDEIIDVTHSAKSGMTTITFGKCNEDGFVCKDIIKVNLKEEKEILDSLYLQHYQIYIDKNQLTMRPEIKDLNLEENSVIEVHEFTIMRDGVPYEIKQKVSIEIDIPDDWATFNFKIYRVEPDGKLTNMFATIKDGKAYFTTDHFSEYIFVGELEGTHKHSYIAATITPTCTENGTTTYTCVCGDSYAEAIEATGHDFDGSKCKNCEYDKASDCGCNCHKKGIANFFFKLILFFQKLFKSNQICKCDAYHY